MRVEKFEPAARSSMGNPAGVGARAWPRGRTD